MKERPILFKPPMVRAILRGEKTQTRREVKGIRLDGLLPGLAKSVCPYGVVGDVLWVRETWWSAEKNFRRGASVIYRADGEELPEGGKWRPSIFMPRTACRLYLEIVEVRVERLHDISEEDAMAEGIDIPNYAEEAIRDVEYPPPSDIFFDLWESINGKESYDANPWVWVLHFKIKEVHTNKLLS